MPPEPAAEAPDHDSLDDHRGLSRRYFIRGVVSIGIGSAILSVGALAKMAQFLLGSQDVTPAEHSDQLRKRLARLRENLTAREQELERLNNDFIEVAKLSRLNSTQGKYFIDYNLRPALAFADDDGLPVLISAKCTHLGCTVGNTTDEQNRISCPCHMSFFDIKTGQPNAGSPANRPLPRLGWVLKDDEDKVVASKSPGGNIEGTPDPDHLDSYTVFIAKRFAADELA
ncbi:MAG: Rieske (2Fe-2S) protein [Candidatus Sumerlaeaceae bacterium]